MSLIIELSVQLSFSDYLTQLFSQFTAEGFSLVCQGLMYLAFAYATLKSE
ncbi:hypothetical protein ACIX9V_004299 [Vibrio vulnificus]